MTRLENDKIAEVRQYFDMLTLLSNLGIVPMQGAQISPAAKEVAAAPRH